MLIERSLADVLKFDELALDRFKVLMEFVEFMKMYMQQTKVEQNDKLFWDGLADEADKAAKARTAQSGPIDPKTKNNLIPELYSYSVTEYVNASNHAAEKR